jgi:hypothetical protein
LASFRGSQTCDTQARFFLEISHSDAALQQAIAALEEHAVQVKTLGSYPAPGWVEERGGVLIFGIELSIQHHHATVL